MFSNNQAQIKPMLGCNKFIPSPTAPSGMARIRVQLGPRVLLLKIIKDRTSKITQHAKSRGRKS